MIFNQVREIFIFTRKERNGLLVLMGLLLFMVCLDLALPLLIPETVYDVIAWKEEAEKHYAKIPVQAEPEKMNFSGEIDPNSAGMADLLKLGIPDRLASNWVKYLQKGGRFKKKEEVMKLYGMTGDLYRKVERNLLVTENPGHAKPAFDHTKKSPDGLSGYGHKDTLRNRRNIFKKDIPLLEINVADSAQLEALPGIGPVLASRIIRYRKLLGGFYEVAQLKEIYGMTEELWTRSSAWLTANPSGMKKLDVNFLTVAELGRHPYIGFRQAKRVIKRRDTIGKFTRKDELSLIFSDDSLQRLSPYLTMSGSEP